VATGGEGLALVHALLQRGETPTGTATILIETSAGAATSNENDPIAHRGVVHLIVHHRQGRMVAVKEIPSLDGADNLEVALGGVEGEVEGAVAAAVVGAVVVAVVDERRILTHSQNKCILNLG